jgi:hypothetical protein
MASALAVRGGASAAADEVEQTARHGAALASAARAPTQPDFITRHNEAHRHECSPGRRYQRGVAVVTGSRRRMTLTRLAAK